MMNMRSLLALGLLAATPALANTVWTGDFETGDLSQWQTQMVSPDRLQVVQDPVHQGGYALKATVVQGDNPIQASGNRNELWNPTPQPEGSESYFRWSTMFAPDFPSEDTWQVFTQWHQPEDCCGSPPVQFYVNGEEIRFTASTAETLMWTTPLVRGVWHDFVLHVKFSDNPQVGFVELWYDGNQVVPKTFAATRANAYLKQGLYRDSSIKPTGVVYHDAMIQGQTLQDVLSEPGIHAPPQANSASKALSAGGGTNAQGGCSSTGGLTSMLGLGLALAALLVQRRRLALAKARRPRRRTPEPFR